MSKRVLVAIALIAMAVAAVLLTGCCNPACNRADTTGGITFTMEDVVRMLTSTSPEATAESLHDRFPSLQAVKVQVEDRDSADVYGSLVLTWSDPNGTIDNIPAERWVVVKARAYSTSVEAQFGPDTLITTGQSVAVQIVAGMNVSAPVTLAATLPVFLGFTPTDGALIGVGEPTSINCHINDVGGGIPTAQLFINGVGQGVQVSSNPAVNYTPPAIATLNLRCEATTTSGGADDASWTVYATPFNGSPGYRTTYSTDLSSGSLAGYHAEVLVVCPPDEYMADVYWSFTRTLTDRYEADSQYDIRTGVPTGPFTRVAYAGVNHANPNGTANLTLAGTTLQVTGLSFNADGIFVAGVSFDAPQTARFPY